MRNPVQRVEATPDRFEQLFRSHHAGVVAYVRRRAAPESVDDVVGETFLVAWRRLEQVPDSPLPWLLAVARNVIATQRRGAARRRALWLALAGRAGRQQTIEVDRSDGRIGAALAQLSEADREALLLIAWDGLTPQQAAEVLGEPPGTFRVRLHRARGRLRRLLEDDRGCAQTGGAHSLRITETAHE